MCRASELIDAAVVGDAVQPRSQRELAITGPQARICADEDVLQRVLGVVPGTGQHLARVGKQALAIAIVDDLERLIVTGPEQFDQLLVRAQAKQRRPDRDPLGQSNPCWEG